MAECVSEVSPMRRCGPTAEEALGYQYCPVSLMVLGFLGQGKATERAGAFELGQRYKRAHWVVTGEDEILGSLQSCKGFVNVCESHLHVVERKFWFRHLPATMGQIPLTLTSKCSVCRMETLPFRTVLWIK